MNTKEYLASLYAKPCECVRCGSCSGGYNFDPFDYMSDGMELCMDCDGSGLTEECDRCMEITEIENDCDC